MSYRRRTRKLRTLRTADLLDLLELVVEESRPRHEQLRRDVRNVIIERVNEAGTDGDRRLYGERIPELFGLLAKLG